MPSDAEQDKSLEHTYLDVYAGPGSGELWNCSKITTNSVLYANITESGSKPWTATVGCINWQDNQWAAMFKNVPFAVDSDSRTGGRRVQVHEFPDREDWVNEDLGRLRQQIDVSGFVFGDKSDEWAEMLFAACTAKGSAGELYLPMRVPLQALCLSVESTFSAEQMGRINFRMTFTIEPWLYDENSSIPTRAKPVSATMLQADSITVASETIEEARAAFEEDFTGTQNASARTNAASYITGVGDKLKTAAANVRMSGLANALVNWVAGEMQTKATSLAAAQSSSTNVMTREAAVLAQENALIAALATGQTGAAVRTSTGQVIEAQGSYTEGFGGLMQTAMMTFSAGATDPSDLAQALLPLTEFVPTNMRKLAAAMPNVDSVQQELKLCETLTAYVRRVSLAQSIVAGVKVAPASQPDASLTRSRLLQQIDEEIESSSDHPTLRDKMQRQRNAVVNYTSWYSQGGAGSVTISTDPGVPLAVTAADAYGPNMEGKDSELMQFNGVDHPLFGPEEVDAMASNDMVTVMGGL